jgi:orotidine-5'-phosphate decarboxylase
MPDTHPLTIDTAETQALDAARERLIVALDYSSAKAALDLVERLSGQCRWFKVGLELYVAAGPVIVETLAGRGHSVFLDLKLHDIPNTVAGAVRSAAGLGAKLLTVHAGGGPVMLAAAREAAGGCAAAPRLLAVTVLTSMDAAQLAATGVAQAPREQVELLARMGMAAGIDGFVCSAQEVGLLREITGPAGTLVTPGIRPAGAEIGDQQRVATPAAALKAGASYLVVGRPITQAADPGAAAEGILREMAGS